MHRFLLIAAMTVLSGCATVYEDRYAYYPGDAYGDYYYGQDDRSYARVSLGYGGYGYGYSAYDSLFWGLQYSYFDPFWYPNFYYGVTYFPRHYGWSYWYAGSYWRWRYFHPYSPYYGSYWDHYYAWNHWPGHRGRYGHGHHDSPRYGSARNAAERLARSPRTGRASIQDARGWRANSLAPHQVSTRATPAGAMPSAVTSRVHREDGLRSRSYVPASRRSGQASLGQAPDSSRYAGGRNRASGRDDWAAGADRNPGRLRNQQGRIDMGGRAARSDYTKPGMFASPAPVREPATGMRFSAPRHNAISTPRQTIHRPPAMRTERSSGARISSPNRPLNRGSRAGRER